MPIYEFGCLECKRRSSVFVRSMSSPVKPVCEHCGSRKLKRLISRVAVHRGGSMDLDDPSSLEGLDENDPRAMARWARQMREETGEDLGPEFDEMVARMEQGEMPEDFGGEGALDDDGFGEDDF